MDKITPYIVTGMILKTYAGRKIPMEIVNCEIQDEPLRKLKDKILDEFSQSGSKDPIVSVDLSVKRLEV